MEIQRTEYGFAVVYQNQKKPSLPLMAASYVGFCLWHVDILAKFSDWWPGAVDYVAKGKLRRHRIMSTGDVRKILAGYGLMFDDKTINREVRHAQKLGLGLPLNKHGNCPYFYGGKISYKPKKEFTFKEIEQQIEKHQKIMFGI
jgi:hypothetical protein